MIQVSVIIPTHNRCEYLRNTIISLQEQNFPKENYEIIVVDNKSTDGTPEVVEECNRKGKKEVSYVKEPELGLHNARHAGAKAAKGEILAYADDDVICDSDWLSELVKPYLDPEVGCVGGKILPKWEAEPPEWVKYFPSWYLSLLDEGEEMKEVPWIYGCNFSIRKSLLFELGGFNPDAFGDKRMWWYRGDGEIGLLRKVYNINKKVMYVPKAIVWHVIPKSRLTLNYFEEVAYKSGIECSFSRHRYRLNKSSKVGLRLRAIIFGGLYVTYAVIANVFSHLGKSFCYKYRTRSSFYRARCLYELRLVYDEDLRSFIKKEKWLE